ncbi:MAG: M20/M25/M40 family metallo-hydrolase [Thermoleophilia bacterium]|nr:M20/M25/M40 family metallo-hydrolase [Thermoleophilia bacterium]
MSASSVSDELIVSMQNSVEALMPQLRTWLDELVRIPSISGDGYPVESIEAAYAAVERMAIGAGVDVERVELPDTNPILCGTRQGPDGAPTVLLYSHYDVVPPGDESAWRSDPFEPVERDGAIYGRGSADTKSNIVALLGAIRAWGDDLPVTIKLLVEGQEEIGGGNIAQLPIQRPDLVHCDLMVIGDMGSIRPGVPTLTTTLRGMANVTVEARTIDAPLHSGQFGGAAPDALVALLHSLASLHDSNGDVAVDGLRRDPWDGGGSTEAEFRELAGIPDGIPLQGTGDLGSRLWSGPAITIIGIDCPSVDGAVNAVQAHARALINVRVHPEQDPAEAQAAVIRHLGRLRPFGIELTAMAGATGSGFAARTDGPSYAAARDAWSAAWGGAQVVTAGVGGSIPLVTELQRAVPDAEVLLVGTTDGFASIHGPDERVLIDELQRATVAEALLFGLLAREHAA